MLCVHTYTRIHVYTILYSVHKSEGGVVVDDNVIVEVEGAKLKPSRFTGNGPSKADLFYITHAGLVQQLSLFHRTQIQS